VSSFRIPIGPFNFEVTSTLASVAQQFAYIYHNYPALKDSDFIDFHTEILAPVGLRNFIKPNVQFQFDHHHIPFKPLPKAQGYAMLEWGMNWCIAANAHQYLVLHSAVISKQGKSIIMPAPPGSGKSTLCAAMAYNGWQLLSDELGLVNRNIETIPCTRPINLKNDSIDILKKLAPSARFSQKAHDTQKGTVALLEPPKTSIDQMFEKSVPKAIVFPKYVANSDCVVTPVSDANSLQQIIDNSFNYHVLGLEGFELATKLIKQCQSFHLEYSQFGEANDALEEIINEH
tara:strand:- start:645 stop:1508 length:864 start_codon:yes stop_codon:yes gene_type:complete